MPPGRLRFAGGKTHMVIPLPIRCADGEDATGQMR